MGTQAESDALFTAGIHHPPPLQAQIFFFSQEKYPFLGFSQRGKPYNHPLALEEISVRNHCLFAPFANMGR